MCATILGESYRYENYNKIDYPKDLHYFKLAIEFHPNNPNYAHNLAEDILRTKSMLNQSFM